MVSSHLLPPNDWLRKQQTWTISKKLFFLELRLLHVLWMSTVFHRLIIDEEILYLAKQQNFPPQRNKIYSALMGNFSSAEYGNRGTSYWLFGLCHLDNIRTHDLTGFYISVIQCLFWLNDTLLPLSLLKNNSEPCFVQFFVLPSCLLKN